jgi:Domain of unknown function (DUF4263)
MEEIVFDPARCRTELAAFKKLLGANNELAERKDIQHFFKKRKQLSALIGTYTGGVGPADLIAFEFPFLGDFSADIVLGDKKAGTFCAVEFEDGKLNSIFRKAANKSMTEWSPRFEHGFSQLVDWFFTLDDFKKTDRFARDFGDGHVRFVALLVLGRNAGLSEHDRRRLRWRTEKVRVDSHTVECLTLDDLYNQLNMRFGFYPAGLKLDK